MCDAVPPGTDDANPVCDALTHEGFSATLEGLRATGHLNESQATSMHSQVFATPGVSSGDALHSAPDTPPLCVYLEPAYDRRYVEQALGEVRVASLNLVDTSHGGHAFATLGSAADVATVLQALPWEAAPAPTPPRESPEGSTRPHALSTASSDLAARGAAFAASQHPHAAPRALRYSEWQRRTRLHSLLQLAYGEGNGRGVAAADTTTPSSTAPPPAPKPRPQDVLLAYHGFGFPSGEEAAAALQRAGAALRASPATAPSKLLPVPVGGVSGGAAAAVCCATLPSGERAALCADALHAHGCGTAQVVSLVCPSGAKRDEVARQLCDPSVVASLCAAPSQPGSSAILPACLAPGVLRPAAAGGEEAGGGVGGGGGGGANPDAPAPSAAAASGVPTVVVALLPQRAAGKRGIDPTRGLPRAAGGRPARKGGEERVDRGAPAKRRRNHPAPPPADDLDAQLLEQLGGF